MLPLGLLRDRNRSGAYVTVLPATLPVAVGIVVSAALSTKLLERLPVRAVSVPGLVLAGLGLLWFSTLSVDSAYTSHILPALFLTYLGLGLGFSGRHSRPFTASPTTSPGSRQRCLMPPSSSVPHSASRSRRPSRPPRPPLTTHTAPRHCEP